MLKLNGSSDGYIENDGYVETAYNLDWEITGFTLLETDGTKNATAVKDSDDNVIAYTYTIDTTTFTYSVDSDSAVAGYTEQFTVTEDGNSFDYTYSYNKTGGYLGYSYSDGTQTISYDADGVVTSIVNDSVVSNDDGTYTYTDAFGLTTYYSDSSGSSITGYSTLYTEQDNDGNTIFSETITYNANWEMIGATTVDGNTTTTYDENWEVLTTSIDFPNGSGTDGTGDDAGLTIYTETNDWGSTKYYVDGDNTLVKYEDIYTDTFTYTNWENEEVSTTYTNSQIFKADGTELGDKGSYSETIDGKTYTGSYSTINNYDDNGSLTGYTTHNERNDKWGSGVSDMTFDENWNIKTENSSGTNTWTWTDEDGTVHTESNSYENITNADGTHSNKWSELDEDGNELRSHTSYFDADWKVTKDVDMDGAKTTTTTYNDDGSIATQETVTDTTALGDGVAELDADGNATGLTIYTETNEWGDTTNYYVDLHTDDNGSDDELIRYEESHSGTWSYEDSDGRTVTSTNTNFTVFDANDKIIGDHGTNKETLSDGTVVNQNSYNRTYNEDGTIKTEENISINTFTFTDVDGNTKVNTFEDINITNEDGTHTNIHQDLVPDGDDEDTELDILSSHTSNFDANWKLLSDVHVEGAKTTTTTYNEDGSIATQTTTTDISKLGDGVVELDADGNATGLTIYTETNEWGDTTKYYTNSDDVLVRYEESHSGTYTYEDPDRGIVTSTYENTTIFDSTDNMVGDYGQNTDTLEDDTVIYHNEYNRTNVYNDDGLLKEIIQIDKYENENSSGSSVTIFDPEWKMISKSNSSDSSFTYTDQDGDEVTNTSTNTTSTTYDTDGNITGYIVKSEWTDTNGNSGESEQLLDTEWCFISETGSNTWLVTTNGEEVKQTSSYTTVLNDDGNRTITSESTDGSSSVRTIDENWNTLSEVSSYSYTNSNDIEYTTTTTYERTYDGENREIGETGTNLRTHKDENGDVVEDSSDDYTETTVYNDDGTIKAVSETGIGTHPDSDTVVYQYSDTFENGERVSTTETNYTYPENTTIVLNTDGTITATDGDSATVNPSTTTTHKEILDDYTTDVNYDALKPSDLGVNIVILDDNDNAVVIDATDAAIIADNDMMFAPWNAITYQDDFAGNDLLLFTAQNFGGISGTIDDTNDAYAMTGADFITVFTTNMNQAASSDTISISTLTGGYVSTAAKDIFVVAEAESDLSFTLDSGDVIDLGADTETTWETEAETASGDVDTNGEWYYADNTLTYFSENSDSGQVETIQITSNGVLTPNEETFYIA